MKKSILIIGAGIYGMQAVRELSNDYNVTLCDSKEITKATIVNQARVHNGYHYPRSKATAHLEQKYYERFKEEFKECLLDDFQQIYAIAKDRQTKTSIDEYHQFCEDINVPHQEFQAPFLNQKTLQGALLADEKAIDTNQLMHKMKALLNDCEYTKINACLVKATWNTLQKYWTVVFANDDVEEYDMLVNCTYGSLNEVEYVCGIESLTPIKHEACEVVLFKPQDWLKGNSLTVMDGPFASVMPFNREGFYSLTSVCHTPHFSWLGRCTKEIREKLNHLQFNCIHLDMIHQMQGFFSEKFIDESEPVKRCFVIKAVPYDAENDDNRLFKMYPVHEKHWVSILSSKLSTIYELSKLRTLCEEMLS